MCSLKDSLEHCNGNFGIDDEMPSCSCFDWNYPMHLCKYFFVIFNNTWSWNAISYNGWRDDKRERRDYKEDREMAVIIEDGKMGREDPDPGMALEDKGINK